LPLVAAIIAICAAWILLRPLLAAPGAEAVVTLRSEEIMRIPLRESDYYRLDLLGEYGVPVSLEVKSGGVRFIDVTCPDHICEKTGVIREDGQTAVCMPNLAAVVIISY
jgi:hypothetical protein